ncbi:Arc family DNA-binding protein [Serratia marcescens]|uniref:Arc family DNA-binding protein n=1 Tax=Serratia marcescens TaxID=615 RepID=UPI0009318A65|nr:Arc family DNA-binding protein [Serratia marcescens]EME1466151.1 Arc family DNA-binding protein [Serratia marcescens]MBH2746433.1 Arc family DNA-binding protein [Serratia marcescens]HAT3746300.1 Arc family DNA-binding protein [Serratia marcescens]HAT3802172.1 Arc family DNA-binding protein [Serratia marcescens]
MKGMRNIAPFGLRMPDQLREAVTERAKRNGRSMNAEIVQIIEDAIAAEKTGFTSGDTAELMKVIRIQSELLQQYKEAIDKGTDMIEEIRATMSNKKPT